MKLLTKINLQFLAFSGLAFLALGIALFFVISYVIYQEADEKLMDTAVVVQKQLEQGAPLPAFAPFIEVNEIPSQPEHHFFANTRMHSISEHEKEDYREINLIKHINGKTYKIIVRESRLESDDLIESIIGLVGVALLGLVICLFLLNYAANRSVWKPFYHNLNVLQNFSLQSMQPVTLQPSAIAEFDTLNRAINGLIDKVIADYQMLKHFSEDAAHELQTPLSIMQAKLESMHNMNTLSSEQAEIIQSLYATVNRMIKLNRNLVLLTKVENRQFHGEKTIHINEALSTKLTDFNELIELKLLNVETQFEADCTVTMNTDLLDILLTNLLSNAINHTQGGGTIAIQITSDTLAICNTAQQPFAEPDKIFNRFYKENPESKSTGLGLAIVKKICDTHAIQINYQFSASQHCFVLNFPL